LQHTLEDLSSARQRQDELRNYASLITRVQEEERRRLARELHDDTAQALIALSLGLDGSRRAMGKLQLPEKDVQWLSNLQDLADHTLEGVRRACRDLRPSVLDDLGLRAALEWLSDSSAERGVPCTFLCLGTPRPLSSEAEIAIFRIVQEALSNIWRHANATHADLELNYLPNLLQVTIRDNGKGFTVAQYSRVESGYPVAGRQIFMEKEESGTLVQYPNARLLQDGRGEPGLGLLGMRERATLIGATLAITSAPEKGCVIILSLPV
jgi:signal transduction histidine kinase